MASLFDCNTTIHSSRSGMEIQYTKVQMSCLRELIDVDLLFELQLLFYVVFIKRGTQFTTHKSQKTGCQIFSQHSFSRTSTERNGSYGGHPFVREIGDSLYKFLQLCLTIELTTLHWSRLYEHGNVKKTNQKPRWDYGTTFVCGILF